jgi:hypothetical protein
VVGGVDGGSALPGDITASPAALGCDFTGGDITSSPDYSSFSGKGTVLRLGNTSGWAQ